MVSRYQSAQIKVSNSLNRVVDFIIDELFKAEYRRLKEVVVKIYKDNERTTGEIGDGFKYQGKPYRLPEREHTNNYVALAPSLYERADAYAADFDKIESDKIAIKRALALALMNAETIQDARDTIPDFLAEIIPAYKAYDRIGKVGCTITNESNYKQYMMHIPLMEFYAAARLLY